MLNYFVFEFVFCLFPALLRHIGSVMPDMPLIALGALVGNHFKGTVTVGVDNPCGAKSVNFSIVRFLRYPDNVLAINILIPMTACCSLVFHVANIVRNFVVYKYYIYSPIVYR